MDKQRKIRAILDSYFGEDLVKKCNGVTCDDYDGEVGCIECLSRKIATLFSPPPAVGDLSKIREGIAGMFTVACANCPHVVGCETDEESHCQLQLDNADSILSLIEPYIEQRIKEAIK